MAWSPLACPWKCSGTIAVADSALAILYALSIASRLGLEALQGTRGGFGDFADRWLERVVDPLNVRTGLVWPHDVLPSLLLGPLGFWPGGFFVLGGWGCRYRTPSGVGRIANPENSEDDQ